MKAIIFANGVMEDWPTGLEFPPDSTLIICADGGLRHCLEYGLVPDAVVGDIDSANESELAELEEQGGKVIRHPIHKKETDLELAIDLARKRGALDITILGAMGNRWDMTLANVMLLASSGLFAIDVRILDGDQEIRCLYGPGKMVINDRQGDRMSLIPVSGRAVSVTLAGFEYPLHKDDLVPGSTWGISNEIKDSVASISLKYGRLLVVLSPMGE